MENSNPTEKQGNPNLFISIVMFALLWGLFTIFFFLPPKIDKPDYLTKPLSSETGISLQKVLKMGKQDLRHENLLSQVRKDLKIPIDLEIKIFIGPYVKISGEGQLVPSYNPFGFILLLDETFYKSLTSEEKIALICHELGHLTNEPIFLMYNLDTIIRFQIEADTYATKYASPEAMMGVLNKVAASQDKLSSRQHLLRIQNLEKIKQAQ